MGGGVQFNSIISGFTLRVMVSSTSTVIMVHEALQVGHLPPGENTIMIK